VAVASRQLKESDIVLGRDMKIQAEKGRLDDFIEVVP
jgi:hypothetical protein